jgi:hypothetical protein
LFSSGFSSEGCALAIPGFDLVNAELIGFDGKNHSYDFRLRSHRFIPIAEKKLIRDRCRGPLVAPMPGMIFDEAETQGCRLADYIGVFVMSGLLGSRQSGLNQGWFRNAKSDFSHPLHKSYV